ncbi:MAG: hypothetical protein JSU94_02645 [Phycisphaerales bacterium]|nr:MAG: hypothetical protein JSU94_02645 [Phycisphaerales bacterium]
MGKKVRVGALLTVVLLAGAPDIGLGNSAVSSVERPYLLPWKIVAEKAREGSLFCFCLREIEPESKIKPTAEDTTGEPKLKEDYCCRASEPLTVKLPEEAVNPDSETNVDLQISRFSEGFWQSQRKATGHTEPNKTHVPAVLEKEGLFKIVFAALALDGQPKQVEAHAIVVGNWKKDILAFCRQIRDQIEANRDSQLIRSSIAVSHFERVMELVSGSPVLSWKILQSLAEAVQSKLDYDTGKCPDLVVGLNKIRFKPFDGAQIEEFAVFVPESKDRTRAQAMYLHADRGRWAAKDNYVNRSGLIDIWWHTVPPEQSRWKTYERFLKIIEQKVLIDKDKVYIEGPCVNGIQAISLALNHPDQWAECNASLGNSYRHLAGNSFNLPMIFVKGGHNEEDLVGYYDFAVKCFEYYNCKHFKWSKTKRIEHLRGTKIPYAVREKNPLRVLYTMESLGNPRAYWVTIKGRRDENLPGTIDACVWGQTILVRTDNIDSYSFDLAGAPLDSNRPVEIIENGQSLGRVTEDIFTKAPGNQEVGAFVKSDRLHGPVGDVFTDPYVVLWGTAGGEEFVKRSEKTARELANGAPCYSDVNAPSELVKSHNVVFVGKPAADCWSSKVCEGLPLRIVENKVAAWDKLYDATDAGFIVIHPNPLFPERYSAVFSATSLRAMTDISRAYAQMKSIRPADIGVFENTGRSGIKWRMLEKLDSNWRLHKGWDRVLTTIKKNHEQWRWHQWVGKVLRRQFKVDVVICEEPFQFKDLTPAGPVTYRDLFNTFKNNWIIMVRMDGKSLRSLLTVPFGNIFKRQVSGPVIEGVTLTRAAKGKDPNTLLIDDLKEETVYTVALPEKCLNGQRMGVVIENYDIIGQAYLVPTLREYLTGEVDKNVDEELDGLIFQIY